MASDTPTKINGGCLCGGVRYVVNVPPDHDWNDSIGTCQCSWCRKVTGSLLFRFHQFAKKEVVFEKDSTLRNYEATPGCKRGFCNACGSYMYFLRDTSLLINLAVGCFDKEDLQRHGRLLTYADGHLWVQNEIPDVTDHLKGDRFDTEPAH